MELFNLNVFSTSRRVQTARVSALFRDQSLTSSDAAYVRARACVRACYLWSECSPGAGGADGPMAREGDGQTPGSVLAGLVLTHQPSLGERDRQRDRDTETDTDRERQTDRHRERQTETETDRDREREEETQRKRD